MNVHVTVLSTVLLPEQNTYHLIYVVKQNRDGSYD